MTIIFRLRNAPICTGPYSAAMILARRFAHDYPDRKKGVRHGVGYQMGGTVYYAYWTPSGKLVVYENEPNTRTESADVSA